MLVINQSTNAWVAGVHVPIGSLDFPVEGAIQIYATSWGPSNIVVASSDTLFTYEEGYALKAGYGLTEAWVLGFALGFVGLGTLGLIRKFGLALGNTSRMENM